MSRRVPRLAATGPIRLSSNHERWIYMPAVALLLSGVGWLIAHFFLGSTGEFGETHHPSEVWWLRVHGAAAMGGLIAFGSLLPVHIARAWQARKNFASGLTLLAVTAVLVLSAYALYYASSEALRPWISVTHWATGLTAGVAMFVHVRVLRRSKTVRTLNPSLSRGTTNMN